MTPRQIAGRFLYGVYHAPIGAVRHFFSAGGPFERRRTEQGRREMEQAAFSLSPPPDGIGPALEIHLLTGRNFWSQTAFCLWTFARQSNRRLAPVIYDDGSLTAEFRQPLSRLFPAVRFVDRSETVARLDKFLPAARFPTLRERWINYPNIRKLIDPHLGSSGWKLVMDSDLLFFREPAFLLKWLQSPAQPLHAVDCETSYGYTRPLMNELAGASVADLINVGLTGLDGSELDWERLEQWCTTLIARERTSYYLEQALIAMLIAGRKCAIAPAEDYVTLPVEPEASACRAVMHHYVADSKRAYFQRNWRRTNLVRSVV